MASNDVCYYCGRQAEVLCDGIVRHIHNPDMPFGCDFPTCDRPMCRGCTVESSPVFYDGTTKGGRREGWVDTLDLCQQCVTKKAVGVHPKAEFGIIKGEGVGDGD